MKKIILAAVASVLIAGPAAADGHGVKIGVLLGFTGPIAVSYTHLTLPTKA